MTDNLNTSIRTYPLDAVRALANQLQDLDYNLAGDDAVDIARDIVIDVTIAVDKLRASEAASPAEGENA